MEENNLDIENTSAVFKDLNLQNERRKDENEFRKNEEFVDVIIKGKDGTEFKVHKIVLASGCPYFKALFHSGMKESNQKIIQLDRNIDGKDFEKLLAYIYTGEIQLSIEEANKFCEYALYFQMINLKEYCADILSKTLNLENCLELWKLGEFLNDALIKYCLKFIMEKSEVIIQSNLFQLNTDKYNEIVTNNNLSISEKLYLYLYNWIKADYNKRKVFLNGVINNFNYSLLSNNFIIKCILQDKILLEQKEFSQKFCEIFEDKLKISSSNCLNGVLPDITHYEISLKTIYKIDSERICEEFKNESTQFGFQAYIYDYNTLFLSGPSTYCYYFCPSLRKIQSFPSLKNSRQYHSVIDLNKKLYVFGGRLVKSVEIFDFNNEKWEIGPPLQYKTESIGLTTWENSIYLFGSFDKQKCSNTVERYDPNDNKLTYVCEAPPIRATKSVRVNDIVFCFNWEGGYKFNIRTNKWFEKIPKAPVEWTSIRSVVLYKDFIAVLGSHNKKSVISFLDLVNNTWSNDKFKLCSDDIVQIT